MVKVITFEADFDTCSSMVSWSVSTESSVESGKAMLEDAAIFC